MTAYHVRFTLTNGSHQNKARCVAVEAAHWQEAVQRVISRYFEKGRDPRPYAVRQQGDEVWQKLEASTEYVPADTNPVNTPLPVTVYDLGGTLKNPSEIKVEYPAWGGAIQ